jgi:hypothetical protein
VSVFNTFRNLFITDPNAATPLSKQQQERGINLRDYTGQDSQVASALM